MTRIQERGGGVSVQKTFFSTTAQMIHLQERSAIFFQRFDSELCYNNQHIDTTWYCFVSPQTLYTINGVSETLFIYNYETTGQCLIKK